MALRGLLISIDASCRHISVGGYCCCINDWTSIDVFTRHLDLCGVAPGISVAIVADPTSRADMASIAALAASRLGADTATVASPVLLTPNHESKLVFAVASEADLVIDLSAGGACATLSGDEPSTRVLVVGTLSADDLRRLRPHVGLARRIDRATARISGAPVLELHSADGSNLIVGLVGADVDGYCAVPSEHTPVVRWPDARVCVEPAVGTVAGCVVAMPGDIILETRSYITSPMTLSISNDHIADVSGAASDTDLFRSLLGTANHRDGYGFARVDIGFSSEIAKRLGDHGSARYAQVESAPRLAGAVTVSFGANSQAGRSRGERVSLVLHNHSLNADNRPLVTNGELQGDLRPDIYESAQ